MELDTEIRRCVQQVSPSRELGLARLLGSSRSAGGKPPLLTAFITPMTSSDFFNPFIISLPPFVNVPSTHLLLLLLEGLKISQVWGLCVSTFMGLSTPWVLVLPSTSRLRCCCLRSNRESRLPRQNPFRCSIAQAALAPVNASPNPHGLRCMTRGGR